MHGVLRKLLRPAIYLTALAAMAPMAGAAAEEAAPQPRYSVIDLGTLGGTRSEALGINNRGEVVGWAEATGGKERAFLYQDGRLRDLGTLPGFSHSRAFDINDRGQVVGTVETPPHASEEAPPHRRAFLWEADRILDLGDGEAHAINEEGTVVGAHQEGPGFRWSPETGREELSSPAPGVLLQPHAINRHGEIAGSRLGGSGVQRAPFHWRDGSLTPLNTEVGVTQPHALALNDRGEVVGIGPRGGGTAYRWSQGHLEYLETLPGAPDLAVPVSTDRRQFSAAYAINNRGQVVGTSSLPGEKPEARRAVLWEEGRVYDLNRLLEPDSGWVLEEARGINDRGQICGSGIFRGQRRAFLLTPLDR